MTRKRLLSAAALLGVLTTTPGCAAILLGYVVTDAVAKDKATATCRSNLAITNQERAAKGQDLIPDMCR